jgi:hypothetical protein
MNTKLLKLALDSGLINYVDHETPRVYFICGHADIEEVEKFAELIVAECTEQVRGQYEPVLEDKEMMKDTHWDGYVQCGVDSVVAIREHFGVEE